jgi:hypothetical protein
VEENGIEEDKKTKIGHSWAEIGIFWGEGICEKNSSWDGGCMNY